MGPHELGTADAPLTWTILLDAAFLVAVLIRAAIGWRGWNGRGGAPSVGGPQPGAGASPPVRRERVGGEREDRVPALAGRSARPR